MKNIILKIVSEIALNTTRNANEKCWTIAYQEELPVEFYEFIKEEKSE